MIANAHNVTSSPTTTGDWNDEVTIIRGYCAGFPYTITIRRGFFGSNLPEVHEAVEEFKTQVERHLAQVREWTRAAIVELRRLMRAPVRRVELPRQGRLWSGRVCASSERWRVRA